MSTWVMGVVSKLGLRGDWTEDHGEGVRQGARLGARQERPSAPSPSPGPGYKVAVGVGRGVIHSFIHSFSRPTWGSSSVSSPTLGTWIQSQWRPWPRCL